MARRHPFALSPEPSPAVHSPDGETRADRLVSVAAQQIADHGLAAVSARSVAAAAGGSPSAVNYNLGGMERLLSTAFEQGVAQTADWLAARRCELQALPHRPEGAVRALEHIVAAWTREARPLALLYQECLAASVGRGVGAAWTALWRDFWLDAAATFGLGEIEGRLLHLFFESEGLYHLSRWSPALEAATLRELADHFGVVWLDAAAGPPMGALALAEQTAGAQAYGTIPHAAMRIAKAAAEVVEGGLGGLTHRAVAARAGVTTGAVTHHFRTIEELVAGAIRGQVLAMAMAGEPDIPAPQTVAQSRSVEHFFQIVRPHAVVDHPSSPALSRRNLFLAAVRRPELAGCGAVIRFAHGGTTRTGLDRVFDLLPEELALHAGVLSRLLSALWFAAAADPEPPATRERLFEAIASRLSHAATAKRLN
ncbi:TetR family transcriptional regulator [Phenylobacterium sp. LjRoot225]|uniref:TetR/AcrR family transcriptional regulator n=1 Tax=Phenylobacterium sp. LjRoot225 TaxID=3342285 RepID=UPI003ED10668